MPENEENDWRFAKGLFYDKRGFVQGLMEGSARERDWAARLSKNQHLVIKPVDKMSAQHDFKAKQKLAQNKS